MRIAAADLVVKEQYRIFLFSVKEQYRIFLFSMDISFVDARSMGKDV